MAQPQHTYVQYFIPYDGDTEEHPNVYLVKKAPKSLTLADVQQAFPLPGQYFFRAKQAFGKSHIWLDLNNQEDPVPAFGTKYVLKVSRISAGSATAAAPVSAPVVARAAASSTLSQAAATKQPAVQQANPAAAAAPPAVKKQQEHHDLLGVFDSSPSSGAAAAAASSSSAVDPFAAPPASRAPGGLAGLGGLGGFGGGSTSTPGGTPIAGLGGSQQRPMGMQQQQQQGSGPRTLGGQPVAQQTQSRPGGGAFGDLDIFKM